MMPVRYIASGFAGLLMAALSAAAPPAADPFAEGSVWVGDFKIAAKDSKPHKWVLTVSERKATAIKGEILAKNAAGETEKIKVEGTATSTDAGAVSLKTEKMGFGQVTLRGKLANGVAVLTFSGKNAVGLTLAGVATLKPLRSDPK